MSTTTIVPPSTSFASFTCPRCGSDLTNHPSVVAAEQRIFDLEDQVKSLSLKVAVSAEKLADYEDELRALRLKNKSLTEQQQQQQQSPAGVTTPQAHSRNISANGKASISSTGTTSTPPTAESETTSTATPPPASTSRFAAFTSYFPGRRAAPTPPPATTESESTASPAPALQSPGFPPPSTPPQNMKNATNATPSSVDAAEIITLKSALTAEQVLRSQLEAQLRDQSTELEELTTQLFSQANEMVAEERRSKAKLEDRIRDMEKKWVERRERLSVLEERMSRAERVRSLVS